MYANITIETADDVIDIVLVSSLLTLNKFHTFSVSFVDFKHGIIAPCFKHVTAGLDVLVFGKTR